MSSKLMILFTEFERISLDFWKQPKFKQNPMYLKSINENFP